jgi:uncharacterized protein YraI
MHPNPNRKIFRPSLALIVAGLIFSLLLGACSGGSATPEPTADIPAVQTQAAQTVVADFTKNAPPPATAVPAPTQTTSAPGPTPDSNVPVAPVPRPEPGQPTAIANYNNFIYSGPGENYVVYGAFLGGYTALVMGRNEDGSWWAVSVPIAPGGYGWVSSEWVTVTNASNVPVMPSSPPPPTAALVPPGADDPQATTLVNTFVRAGPGADYPAYGVATAGSTGRVLGVSADNTWWVVRLDPAVVGAGFGWVEAAYVTTKNVSDVPVVASSPAPQASTLPAPAPGAATATALDYLNVRSGPGVNYTVLGVAAPGATAEIKAKSGDDQWWQIVVPTSTLSADGVAWVSASYTYAQNAASVPVVEAPPTPPAVSPDNPITVGSCALLSQTPADKTQFSPGETFETTWVLQNTGNTAWDQAQALIRFLGAYNGESLHTGTDIYNLPATINSGWNLPVTIPMLAPDQPGIYAEQWGVSLGSTVVCPFFVVIEVK